MIISSALVLVAAIGVAPDPRPRLVELSLAGRLDQSLAGIEREFATDPERAEQLGLEILRGDLLERSGNPREAARSFARALGGNPLFAPWARYRLARAQELLGHPEVAAGLIASLLARPAGGALERRAIDLLRRTVDAGGDCRLLGGLPRDRFAGRSRRVRDLIEIRCRARAGPDSDPGPLKAFLERATDDELAWDAAEPNLGHSGIAGDRTLALLLGLTAYHHRDFDRALSLFGRWNEDFTRGPFDTLGSDAAYAEARSTFWLGRFAPASELYRRIAQETRLDERRADALFQAGRSRELGGDPEGAHESFLQAYLVDPRGRWGGAALLSLLRLEYLRGDGSGARKRLTDLAAEPSFSSFTARGALFLAVSELVRGRTDRVASFLGIAERTRGRSAEEIAFWRGRLAEQRGDSSRALDHYLEATGRRPFHPFAAAARSRATAPAMARPAAERLERLAASSDPFALQQAAALAQTAPAREQLRRRGAAQLAGRPATAAWLEGSTLPIEEWPLWSRSLELVEEKLVALGLVAEAPQTAVALFSTRDPRSAMTGAAMLSTRSATRVAISLADAAFSRRPAEVPLDWVAPAWLGLLYPLPWADAIASQSTARGVDPALLAAVIREESRFDPLAVSPAAARGLTQFVLPTARRLASVAGTADFGADDLHDPLVAIPLGASYLAELGRRFQGEVVAVAAAYNAGEDQTALWRRACYSSEDVELLSKITFGETRAYVTHVIESRNVYRMLTLTGRR